MCNHVVLRGSWFDLPACRRHARSSSDPVIDWLLDADPSIRWQVMRDLTDTPAEIVAAERARVASEGWGRGCSTNSDPTANGAMASPRRSGGRTCTRWCSCATWGSTRRARARETAIDRVRDNVTWGPEFGDSPFFEGEVEPCINGRVVALGAYFGERSDRLVDRLLGEQLADGGWNCEAERGSVRSSFHTTICVLEGLLAFEQAFGATPPVTDARRRAAGVSPRASPAPTVVDRRDHQPGVDAVRVSAALALRRAARARLPARGGRARRMSASRRPSRPCSSGARPTGAGCSTCDTRTRCTRSWPAPSARRIAGSRCARDECSTGSDDAGSSFTQSVKLLPA